MRNILKVKRLKMLMMAKIASTISPTLSLIDAIRSDNIHDPGEHENSFDISHLDIKSNLYNQTYNMNFNLQKWYTCTWVQLLLIFSVSVCLKMILVPAYYSTDQDVHQNWLRITATQPLSQWYYDVVTVLVRFKANGLWTTLLFLLIISMFQAAFHSLSILVLQMQNTINQFKTTIIFQRFTVIISELPFLLVLYWIFKQINTTMIIAYFSLPFILLDNIHFQYNIVMQAIFLLSVELMRRKKFEQGAFVYSCLLNFKHIYLYAALAFFVCIVKEYIFKEVSFENKVKKLVKIGIITLIPFGISFGPFFLVGGFSQISQILSRLFPFQRGLIHDYWAPNFWALYYFVDKVVNIIEVKMGLKVISFKQAGYLHQLSNLPDVKPFLTTLMILIVTIPILVIYWKKNTRFEMLVFLCGCSFFLFGYHVHEKAITPYIGLFMVLLKKEEQKFYLLDCAVLVNIINLLPLLIDPNEKLLRLVVPLLWIAIWERRGEMSSFIEVTVVTVGLGLIFFQECVHPVLFKNRMEFLPLMLNSVFCATFNICWIAKIYANEMKKQRDNNDYEKIPSQVEE